MLSPVIFVEDLRDDLLNPNPFIHKDDPDPWTAWAVADENVEYSISIYRGRANVTEAPQSSTMTCSFVLSELNATTFDGIQIGSRIRFSLADGGDVVTDRFTGRITDMSLTHRGSHGILSVDAVGLIADMNTRNVGDEDFLETTANARFIEICHRVEMPSIVRADLDSPILYRRKSNDEPAAASAQSLAESIGAAVFDTGSGQIMMQRYKDRMNNDVFILHDHWEDYPEPWEEFVGNWLGYTEKPQPLTTLQMPCDTVAFEPIWKQFSGGIANVFTVRYYNGSFTLEDQDSIDQFGRRDFEITTELKDGGDALDRIATLRSAFATPEWRLDSVQVLLNNLDEDLFHDVMEQEIIGRRVQLTGLPQPAPYQTITMFVEGISEVYVPTAWTMTMALSPRIWSSIGLMWREPDPAVKWLDCLPTWDQATTIESLVGGA